LPGGAGNETSGKRREGREGVSGFPWLTALTVTPLAGGVIVVGLGARQKAVARALGLASSLLSLGLAVLIWASFDPASTELQLVERSPWIPTLGIEYFVGADGVSLLMVLLSAAVVPMALLASWKV